MDILAKEGVLFTDAFAQATWTRPSGASMLSSTYPSVHGVNGLYDALPAYVPVVPEYLKRAGFRTIAISSMGNISPHFGFGKGFDVFIELYKDKNIAEKRRKVLLQNQQWEPHFKGDEGRDWVPITTSEDINEFTLSLLKTGGTEDVFIFIWSLDTHGPYFHRDMRLAYFYPDDVIWVTEDVAKAKSDVEIDRLMRLYEDMIYYNDYHLGALIEKLKLLGLYDEALLIVTGDHGEAFGEHGFNSHGREPYDELIRVPLIMKFPFSKYHGEVSSIVQHIDIVPTIIDYLSVPKDDMMLQGKSAMPLLREKARINEYAFTEHRPSSQYPGYISLRSQDYKCLAVRRKEVTFWQWLKERNRLWPSPWFIYKPMFLYDLRKDPGERLNLIHEEIDESQRFQSRIKTILKANEKVAQTLKKKKGLGEGFDAKEVKKVDDEVSRQLKTLGYFD